MIDEYTRLLEAAAELEDEKTAEAAVSKLIAHLKSTGRVRMLEEIATELKKIAARRAKLAPKVEVASKKEAASALKAAKDAGLSAKEAVINESLVSGWRAYGHGKLIDNSGKRALIDIYRNISTN